MLSVVCVVCGGVGAATTQVGVLDLTEDVEITVAAGDRYEICTLSAAAVHTLTKKGEGDLYVGRVTSLNPRIDLQGGHLFVGPNLTKPALFSSAAFHVDANATNKMTIVEADDKQYVSKWKDVNGGSHYAVNNTAGRQPWLTTLENGNRMLDFGSLKNTTLTTGTGGYLGFDSNITGIRAAFCVQQVHPETIAAPKGACPQGIANYDASVFMTYTKSEGAGPSYANKWQSCTKQVRATTDESGLGGSISVNGTKLATVIKSASTDLEVIDYKIVDPVSGTDYGRAGRFVNDYANNSSGGLMIGEAALFTTALTDEQHALLSHYLLVKWHDYGIPRTEQITVGEGTSASIWNGAAYDVIGHTTQVGLLNLTEDIEITVAAGDRYEICTLSASEIHTLTKKGDGDLYVGRVTSVNPRIKVQGGRLFVGPKLTTPALFFSSAAFHVDANATNTMTTTESEGRLYVSRWNDVNGGTHYAANSSSATQPWLTTLNNGNRMLDFGVLRNSSVTSGTGAYLPFDSAVTGIRAAFCVQQVHPETVAAPQGACPQGIANYDASVFMTYTKSEGAGPSYANKWQDCTKQVRSTTDQSGLGGSISVNGMKLSTVGSAASTNLEVIDYTIVDPVSGTDYGRAGRFVYDYANNAYGGLMIGEAALFTTPLTDDQHTLLSQYLMVKWIEYGIPKTNRISLENGAKAFVWNGTSYDAVVRKGLVITFR